MKYSAIEKMYYGERGQGELLNMSEEYKQSHNEFSALYKKFREKIEEDPDLLELFDQVMDAYSDAHAVDLKDRYAAGFRFGALMQMDILQGK